jgi:hypothetical protein
MVARALFTVSLIAGWIGFVSPAFAEDVAPPPNAAATARWDAVTGQLKIAYHGAEILSAAVTARNADDKEVAVKLDSKTDTTDEKVAQTLTFTSAEPTENVMLVLRGTVAGSGEAFPAETDSEAQQEVQFADLGLHDDRDYVVFEFWSQKFLGKFRGSFTAPPMDDNNGMQVFAIREARAHPWVLSTTRHISQGGVSVLDLKWNAAAKTLSGRSAAVIDDPYVMTVHLPEGFRVENARIEGEEAAISNQQETAAIRTVPSATRTVPWTIQFSNESQ